MRTSPGLAVLTMLGVLSGAVAGIDDAAAQFGFFLGPEGQQRAARPRRRAAPAQRRLPAAPARPATGLKPAPVFPLYTPPVEVPVPPPRPHFPDDAPPPAAAEPVPAGGPPRPPAEMQTLPNRPAEPAKPSAPEQPAEPTKPQLPARPAPDVPPEPRKGTGKPAPMVVQPVPDELPPKGPEGRPPSKPVAPIAKPPARSETPPPAELPKQPVVPPSAEPAAPPPSVGTPPPTNPPLPPPKPPELTKPGAPGVAPSGARLGETPRQPEDDAACLDRLKARNVTTEPATIGPQPDERCTVVRPVRLVGLSLPDGGKVEFPEHPTIACTTAETFSTYVRDLLSPLAKGHFGSPLAGVWTGPGLECRSRDNIFGAKLSAHGQGLAIDVAQLKLADGRKIEVGDPKGETGQAFESAARAGACGYFHTVLGPGSDSYHRTHWHFDLIVRGAQGDSKYCK